MGADRDVRRAELLRQLGRLLINRKRCLRVSALSLQARHVVEGDEPARIVAQCGVEPEGVLTGILGRDEVATPQLEDTEVHGSACSHVERVRLAGERESGDRKSTRLNSSHLVISY